MFQRIKVALMSLRWQRPVNSTPMFKFSYQTEGTLQISKLTIQSWAWRHPSVTPALGKHR